MAQQLWGWCLTRKISPHAEHLPGKENTLADWESRHTYDSSNWKLLPLVFRSLNSLLGPFSVDLFASRTNNQLPVYFSWKPDPQAKAVDVFSVPWSMKNPYLFPPFNLIGRALSKIQEEALHCACLIAPAWPAQGWYPQLLEMLVKEPILLLSEEDLLLDPQLSPHPLILEERMSLTAWPISGKPTLCKAFQTELQISYYSHGEATLTRHITQPGLNGIAGVVEGRVIPFQHLWEK